jgi:alpha-beta hydrolase superfamily lysophospholipase
VLAAMVAVAALSERATADTARERGYAGYAFKTLTADDARAVGLAEPAGVVVRQVFAGGAAAQAGIQPGDVVRQYDDHVIRDQVQILDVLRRYYAGDRIRVSLIRARRPLVVTMTLQPFPKEQSGDVRVEYTWFTHDRLRFRAVVTSPLGSEGRRLPALLLVSALASPRLIQTPTFDLARDLAHAAARAGFRVLRFELRGSGDSEGEDYRTRDFKTEVADNLAALDHLMGRGDVDRTRVFVFGHSTGGQIAGIVAAERGAGAILSGTIGRTYYERMADTIRAQAQLAGDRPEVVDRKVQESLDLATALANGEPLARILERRPALKRFLTSTGRLMDDRNADYWRQQVGLNLGEIYGRLKGPVLIVYGASDFITQLACHERIRDTAQGSGNRDVTLAVIPGMDHRYAAARDRMASFAAYKAGTFTPSPEGRRVITAWLTERARRK